MGCKRKPGPNDCPECFADGERWMYGADGPAREAARKRWLRCRTCAVVMAKIRRAQRKGRAA